MAGSLIQSSLFRQEEEYAVVDDVLKIKVHGTTKSP